MSNILLMMLIVVGIPALTWWANSPLHSRIADLRERVWDLEQDKTYLKHQIRQLNLQVGRLEKGERDE